MGNTKVWGNDSGEDPDRCKRKKGEREKKLHLFRIKKKDTNGESCLFFKKRGKSLSF